MRFLFLAFCLATIICRLPTQQQVEVEGMKFTYQVLDTTLLIKLEAPTKGWLGLGFNNKNSIIDSDLYLFHVVDGEASGQDMHVVSFGNPNLDASIGGCDNITMLTGQETKGFTKISFELPLNSYDDFDYLHRIGEPFWLILAYSWHDDFGHHSAMRKHIPFTLEH